MTTRSGKTQSSKDDAPSLRARAEDAYEGARERAIEAYDATRERASEATARAREGVGEAPLMALGGGLALGALIAALLPRTKAEDRLLGPVGERITGGATGAWLSGTMHADRSNSMNASTASCGLNVFVMQPSGNSVS